MASSSSDNLDDLLRAQPGIWRGRATPAARSGGLATGFPALDRILPQGGWPATGVVEVVCATRQPAPLRLFLPLIARLTQRGHRVVMVGTPTQLVPFAPALQQADIVLEHLFWVRCSIQREIWWVIDSGLRTEGCAAVFGWPGAQGRGVDIKAVRRWQAACESGQALCVLFTTPRTHDHDHGLPNVHLRLRVSGDRVAILKARGTHATPTVTL